MAARRKTRSTTTASERRFVRSAMEHGRDLAAKAIRAREAQSKGGLEAKGPSNGLLIAEGDSWFDYPFFDTLERLEGSFNFEIESVAHKGDTVESMAYDASQSATLARLFDKLGRQNSQPRAILLSGGGNDIAGDEFAILLNHASSGLPPLNDQVAAGVIEVRLKSAIVSVISGVTALSRHYFNRVVPIVIHGYAHPFPDGRGYLGGAWILPGPWLKPGFTQKGYSDLATNAGLVGDLIDRFNAMLQTLPDAAGLGHVTYLDLRQVLSSDLATYKKTWNDELHPTKPGFEAVAAEFARVVKGFPLPGFSGPKTRRPVGPKARGAVESRSRPLVGSESRRLVSPESGLLLESESRRLMGSKSRRSVKANARRATGAKKAVARRSPQRGAARRGRK